MKSTWNLLKVKIVIHLRTIVYHLKIINSSTINLKKSFDSMMLDAFKMALNEREQLKLEENVYITM